MSAYSDAKSLFDFTMFHMGHLLTVSQFPCLEDNTIARKMAQAAGSLGLLQRGELTLPDVYP